MSDPGVLMGRADLERAFTLLGERLVRRGWSPTCSSSAAAPQRMLENSAMGKDHSDLSKWDCSPHTMAKHDMPA